MQSLVSNYVNDVDSFVSCFKGLNKTFGWNNRANAIHFSHIITKRLSAVLFYFIQLVGCVHTIPHINNVDVPLYTGLIQVYEAYKKRKDAEGEDEAIIEFPELKGHINWITYQD